MSDDADYRTVEELLDAASDAPTYGVNARELILQAARQIAQVARVMRQTVVERLAGQHLALALHSTQMPVLPKSLAEIPEQRQEAISAAVAQEEELYQRGRASKSVYLNFAARTNAGLWLANSASEPQTDNKDELARAQSRGTDGNVPMDGQLDETIPSPSEDQASKRRRLAQPSSLVEVDIDWSKPQTAVRESEAERDTLERQSHQASDRGDSETSAPSPTVSSKLEPPSISIASPSERRGRKLAVEGPSERAEPSAVQRDRFETSADKVAAESRPTLEGLEDYSPSRHGGESPPRGPSAPLTTPKAKQSTLIKAPPGHPAVVTALVKFLKAQLDPLYDSKAVSRVVYKRAMQKTVEKVMRSHKSATSPQFLSKEGSKISVLLMQYVDRLSSNAN